MFSKIYFILATFLITNPVIIKGQQHPFNYSTLVNTTLGTKGKGFGVEQRYLEAGYTFPGATCPFGMVQFTTTFFDENKGFVINQLSGAGCHNMGNMPLLPLNWKLETSPDDMMDLKPVITIKNAESGYYKASVGTTSEIELSATTRTGMARIRFNTCKELGTVIIGTGINSSVITHASARIIDKNKVEGFADGGHFCGISANYKLYFIAEFDHDAIETGTWKDKILQNKVDSVSGPNSGVFLTFSVEDGKPVQYKVGISYVSLENARQNLKIENSGWNFEQIKKQAQDQWNQYLGKIEVSGGPKDHIIQFYSHLYHSFIHPSVFSDVNGEYTGADQQVHKTKTTYYTGFSNWDTYRTQIQLISLFAPEETADIIRSILNFAQQSGGGFPRWVLANYETGIMQGDPTSILVSNAYAFGAKDFDTSLALEIMRRGAEVPGTKSQNELTRPNMEEYNTKGYISESMGASMSLEYNSADFAIAQFALKAFNDTALYTKYLKSSRKWKNMYNPRTTWLQSRNTDGSWKNQEEDWREASYKNYFWMVPYNLKGLIDIIGGPEAASKRLDAFFEKLNANYNQGWFAAGNEPDFQVPWIYNWTGKPYKTQDMVQRIIKEQYSNRDCGLPGNDDMGAMGAWYIWANIGLYPMIPGIAGFAINSPSFPSIKIHLNNRIVSIEGGSETAPYIQKLTLDHEEFSKCWIDLNKFLNSHELKYELSTEPNKNWGLDNIPPSFN